jgi:hypothetical protein
MLSDINKTSTIVRASSSPYEIADDEEEDHLPPSFNLNETNDESHNLADRETTEPVTVQIILSNPSASVEPPISAIQISVVKVLHEISDGYSVFYKVLVSDGFVETVCNYSSPKFYFPFIPPTLLFFHVLHFNLVIPSSLPPHKLFLSLVLVKQRYFRFPFW